MSWWEIFGEIFGEALPAVFGGILAFGGLAFLRYAVIRGSMPEIVVCAAAFFVGLFLLWLSKREP